ncbi:zinc finger protein 62 [Bicyclus anynana]|uniref:Zinc finger protein 62 n=1 Tax=Bicyclus anynana TaxID=110368 RepID=A0A6J1N568_BICAN|nr:zinc finger protein 62 [Bicyclus anynana]
MNTTIMKIEAEAETCSVCGGGGDLLTPEEHDAGAPPMQVPLRTMLLHINNNKVLPDGKLCTSCIRRALEAYEFSSALSTRTAPPLSEKIRALRRKLHELTQKIDVFIVVGGPNSGGAYSEDDIIMVDKDALAAAAAADDEDLEKARNACGDSVYQCSICPLSFQHASEYREHVSTHPSGARHSCWTCGAQFTSRDALKEHSILHAAADAQSLVCNLCAVACQSSVELRRHEATCAATCPLCAVRCGSRSALSAHARRSHTRSPPLLCAQCFAASPSAEAHAAHALTHRQADRFVCGYDACILRFATRNDLLAHIRKCHAGEAADIPDASASAPPTTVTCDQCDRTFGSVAAMKRHARVHRREIPQEEPDWEGGEIEQALSRMHGMEPLDGDVEYLEMEALEEI